MAFEGEGGVGIGWRPEIAADLLTHPRSVDLVEVTAESCTTRAALREARAVSEAWPVAVHGVKASLGSAEGADFDRVTKLGAVARELRARFVSEHVAYVRAGGVEIGHLTSVPFTREAVRVVARNVAKARRLLPDVPLLLENVAWSFRWPDDSMDEGDFHAEVVAATGCDLLLDVGNLFANAVNAGRDPAELLARYPLDRVAMLHVAGGILEDGFYFDTHAHPVADAVVDLVARAIALAGDVPLVLERDASFPPFGDLRGELARLSSIPGSPRAVRAPRSPQPIAATSDETTRLDGAQRAVAKLLTAPEAPADVALVRARDILRRKRVDDALPLLPALAAFGERAVTIAARCLEGATRPASGVAVHDALRIADAAEADESLRDAARADALVLRARYVEDERGTRPRAAPFLSRARTGDVTRWVMKGPGTNAPVRVIERRD